MKEHRQIDIPHSVLSLLLQVSTYGQAFLRVLLGYDPKDKLMITPFWPGNDVQVVPPTPQP